jgi:hypothetical protein
VSAFLGSDRHGHFGLCAQKGSQPMRLAYIIVASALVCAGREAAPTAHAD